MTDEQVEKIIKANMSLQMNIPGIRANFEEALRKPWVGLTRDERMSIINRLIGQDWVYALDAIEAKLKEKNA